VPTTPLLVLRAVPLFTHRTSSALCQLSGEGSSIVYAQNVRREFHCLHDNKAPLYHERLLNPVTFQCKMKPILTSKSTKSQIQSECKHREHNKKRKGKGKGREQTGSQADISAAEGVVAGVVESDPPPPAARSKIISNAGRV